VKLYFIGIDTAMSAFVFIVTNNFTIIQVFLVSKARLVLTHVPLVHLFVLSR
jgi:hypothetical protein